MRAIPLRYTRFDCPMGVGVATEGQKGLKAGETPHPPGGIRNLFTIGRGIGLADLARKNASHFVPPISVSNDQTLTDDYRKAAPKPPCSLRAKFAHP